MVDQILWYCFRKHTMPIPENNQIPCKSQIEHISAMNQQTNHYRYIHAYKLHLQPPGYKTLSAWRTYYDRSNGEAGEANCCNTANLQRTLKYVNTAQYMLTTQWIKYMLPNRKPSCQLFPCGRIKNGSGPTGPGKLDKPPEVSFGDLLTRWGSALA
jgi:hypothetical protein